jgi:hypothetical protein
VPNAAAAAATLVLRPMNEPGFEDAIRAGRRVTRDVALLSRPGHRVALPGRFRLPAGSIRPSPTWRIVLAAVGTLGLVWIVGFGWARAFAGRGVTATAVAPASGIAVIVIGGLLVDRLGIRLTGAIPAILSVALGASGYAFAARRATRQRSVLQC